MENLELAMDSVAVLELRVVSHRMFDQATEALAMLMARARQRRGQERMRARALLLRGAAGAGKSTVIQHFLDSNPASRNEDGLIMPVAAIEVPPAPSLRAIVDAIYSGLGYRAERSVTAEEIVKDLKGKVDLLGVHAMVLDEAHHILDSRDAANVTEFLKSLLNRLGCSLVFSGLDKLVDLRGSLQLNRRLFPDVALRPYNFRNTAERLEFMRFLAAIERHALQLPEASNLTDQNVARRLYTATGGLIGIVTKYLSHAVLLAKVRGLRHIDLDLLAEIDASWSGTAAPPDDITFLNDISFDQGFDIEALLAGVGRVRIDKQTNPFKCDDAKLEALMEQRGAHAIVKPQHRRLDRRMKGTGPDSPKAFK